MLETKRSARDMDWSWGVLLGKKEIILARWVCKERLVSKSYCSLHVEFHLHLKLRTIQSLSVLGLTLLGLKGYI